MVHLQCVETKKSVVLDDLQVEIIRGVLDNRKYSYLFNYCSYFLSISSDTLLHALKDLYSAYTNLKPLDSTHYEPNRINKTRLAIRDILEYAPAILKPEHCSVLRVLRNL